MSETVSDGCKQRKWGAVNFVMFFAGIMFSYDMANNIFNNVGIAIILTVIASPFIFLAIRPSKISS